MGAQLHWLDPVFAALLRATVQASLVAIVILAARQVMRRWLTPGAAYALWPLLLLPLAAPLLPAGPFSLPSFARHESRLTASATMTTKALPSESNNGEWRVEYGPIAQDPSNAYSPSHSAAADAGPASLRWTSVAASVWLIGVLLLMARVVISHILTLRQVRRWPAITDPVTLALLDECRRRLRLRRMPQPVAAPPGRGPALLGIVRPRLLLPGNPPSPLSREELRFVILHELVHLKRFDVLAELLLTLLQIAHWFNPLIWLAAARCRADREVACDARVLALAGGDADTRADYGRTILRLATEVIAPLRPAPRRAAATVGILETRSPLERRLRMIAFSPSRNLVRWPTALVALAAVALVACSNAQAPKPPANAQPDVSATKADADAAAPATKPPTTTASEAFAAFAGIFNPHDVNARPVPAEDPALAATLSRRIPDLTFEGQPLGDVIDFLREASGANIFVNWRALEVAGIDRKRAVSLRLRDVEMRKALHIILDAAAGGSRRLAFKADQGVITISTAEDLSSDTLTRVYDIRDLTIIIRDFMPVGAADLHGLSPAPAAAVRAAPAPPATAPAPRDADNAAAEAVQADRQRQVEALIKLIRETVEPQAWDKRAALRELSGQLIVTATPEMHTSIVQLLTQLRETRGIQVLLEAKFLTFDEAALEALPADLREAVSGELRAAKDPVAVTGDPAVAASRPAPPARAKHTFLDGPQVEQLLAAGQASKGATILSAPRLMLFNGQAAYVMINTQRAYVADYATLKQPDGTTKYEPQHGVAQAGIMLWAQATASADRNYVTLSLRPRLSHLAGLDEIPWDRNPPGEKLTVHRPKLLASELSTTVSIPDGGTLLLGGLKGYVGEAQGDPAAAAKASPVLMLVTPKLIIQREVEHKQFPLLNERLDDKTGAK